MIYIDYPKKMKFMRLIGLNGHWEEARRNSKATLTYALCIPQWLISLTLGLIEAAIVLTEHSWGWNWPFWIISTLSRGPIPSDYIDPNSYQICTDLRGVGNLWKMGRNPPMGGPKQCLRRDNTSVYKTHCIQMQMYPIIIDMQMNVFKF